MSDAASVPFDASALLELGFGPFFSQQVASEAMMHGRVVRVTAVQRSHIGVSDGSSERLLPITAGYGDARAPEDRPTVGDWVLLDASTDRVSKVLERRSVFKRVAAGVQPRAQLIAANVDTLFVVTSCNEEFNESRLERYLALAATAGVSPVIVLTKTDLTETPEAFVTRARSVQRDVPIEAVDARDANSVVGLVAWVPTGTTAAFVGSSGVGKSTLINSLLRERVAETQAIRAGDSKGRHTTTARSLRRLPGGGLLIDVPGMRELKVADLGTAVDDVFSDIADFAQRCRFKDCGHGEEPGCAVRAAVVDGALDARRLENYRKLLREEARHNQSLAERRSRERQFSKVVRNMKALRKELGIDR